MKQCAECNRRYPDFASACKCGSEFPKLESAESESDASSGSMILSLCSLGAAFGILISIVGGLYLIMHHHPVIGILAGVLGAIHNAGLMIVFNEVNGSIGERKAAQP